MNCSEVVPVACEVNAMRAMMINAILYTLKASKKNLSLIIISGLLFSGNTWKSWLLLPVSRLVSPGFTSKKHLSRFINRLVVFDND